MALDSIDLYNPETQEDWFPAYETLLSEAPVYQIPDSTIYVISKYEDILTVVRDPKTFSNQPELHGGDPLIEHAEASQYYIDHGLGKETGRSRWQLLGMDPPDHRKYRELIDSKMMSKSVLEGIRPFVEETVDQLIDGFVQSGEIELVKDFATPLPVTVITAMIGFPLEDMPQLKEWSVAWALPFARNLTLEQSMDVARKGVEFQDYIKRIADERRKNPTDDIISHLVQARYEGDRLLTDHEIASIVDNMYIGGNETTTLTITSGLWIMLREPSIYQALVEDPSKIPNFASEVMRIESPTQGLYRTVVEDTEIRGVPLPRGSTVHIRYGAANRDSDIFECPAEFDMERENASHHIAFSQGEHGCPGAALARLEQEIAYERLLSRLSNLRLTPGKNDFKHLPGFVLRGLKSLYLSFDPE